MKFVISYQVVWFVQCSMMSNLLRVANNGARLRLSDHNGAKKGSLNTEPQCASDKLFFELDICLRRVV